MQSPQLTHLHEKLIPLNCSLFGSLHSNQMRRRYLNSFAMDAPLTRKAKANDKRDEGNSSNNKNTILFINEKDIHLQYY